MSQTAGVRSAWRLHASTTPTRPHYRSDEVGTALAVRGHASWVLATHFISVDRTKANWLALRDAMDEGHTAAEVRRERLG